MKARRVIDGKVFFFHSRHMDREEAKQEAEELRNSYGLVRVLPSWLPDYGSIRCWTVFYSPYSKLNGNNHALGNKGD